MWNEQIARAIYWSAITTLMNELGYDNTEKTVFIFNTEDKYEVWLYTDFSLYQLIQIHDMLQKEWEKFCNTLVGHIK